MIEEDYQFAFVRRVLVAHLSVAPVTCAPEDETDPRAVELAAALLELWQRHLSQIADSYGVGRAAFAIEWEFDADHVIHRPKLHSIPFVESTPKWDQETGQFLGIEIAGTELTLPPGQCWHCPTDADALHPHGRSRYLGAPRAEFDRRRNLFELYNEHIEHFALRGGVAYGPGTAVGTDGEEIDLAANMQAAHRARRPGTLLYVEGERGADGRYPQEFVEPPFLDPPAPIDAAMRESDIRVLRSQGLSELSVQQTGDLGSYALAVVHRLVTLSVVYELAGQWGGSFGRYVAEVASQFNLGSKGGIKFDTPRLTELPDSAVADLAKAIVQQPDLSPVAAAIDLRRLLESGGVPVGDDFEDRLAKAVEARKAAQAPPTIPGATPFADPLVPGAVALDCGTGKGGFKSGNKCSTGGGGGGARKGSRVKVKVGGVEMEGKVLAVKDGVATVKTDVGRVKIKEDNLTTLDDGESVKKKEPRKDAPKPESKPAPKPDTPKPAAPKAESKPAAQPSGFADAKTVRKVDPNSPPNADKMKSATAALPEKDKDALRAYTAGEVDYRNINSSLRDGKPLTGKAKADFEAVNSAVEKAGALPEGTTVYRGLNLDSAEKTALVGQFREAAANGGAVEMPGLNSTSVDPEAAAGFARTEGRGPVMFEIKPKSGAYVTELSGFDAMARKSGGRAENEILLPHGKKYRVASVLDDVSVGKKVKKGFGYTVIQLEEV